MNLPRVKSIASLSRGLKVLQLMQVTGAASLNDLHRLTGYPKATLLRILRTLWEQGMIWKRIHDGYYIASYSLAELATRTDRDTRLVELASPHLARLTEEVLWPSILAVPRLTHMELLETNVPRSYFNEIPLGPLGFQINMLRSAAGRAYIAHCDPASRAATLEALRKGGRKGDRYASSETFIQHMVAQTRADGFGLRDPDFGGHYDADRIEVDDGRDSLAVPIYAGGQVLATLNVTWSMRALSRAQAVERLVEPLLRTAGNISTALVEKHFGFTE
jgi:IclR family mhp operon transcriptional activator